MVVLSLGPYLIIFGKMHYSVFDYHIGPISLPMKWLNSVPVLNQIRVPARFIIGAGISLSVLMTYGIACLIKVVGKQYKIIILAVTISLIYVEFYARKLPTHGIEIPEIVQCLHQQPAGTVLQIPASVSTGLWRVNPYQIQGIERLWQFFQTIHGKATISVSFSRLPPFYSGYFKTMPIIGPLLEHQDRASPQDCITMFERGERSAGHVIQALRLRYILIYPGWHDRHLTQAVINIFRAKLIDKQDDFYLYKISPVESAPGKVFYGDNDELYRAGLWSSDKESRGGRTCRRLLGDFGYLLVPFSDSGGNSLTFSALLPTESSHVSERYQISIENMVPQTIEVNKNWQTFSIPCTIPDLPGRLARVLIEKRKTLQFPFNFTPRHNMVKLPQQVGIVIEWAEMSSRAPH